MLQQQQRQPPVGTACVFCYSLIFLTRFHVMRVNRQQIWHGVRKKRLTSTSIRLYNRQAAKQQQKEALAEQTHRPIAHPAHLISKEVRAGMGFQELRPFSTKKGALKHRSTRPGGGHSFWGARDARLSTSQLPRSFEVFPTTHAGIHLNLRHLWPPTNRAPPQGSTLTPSLGLISKYTTTQKPGGCVCARSDALAPRESVDWTRRQL